MLTTRLMIRASARLWANRCTKTLANSGLNKNALPPRTLLQHGGGVFEHGVCDSPA
jgi:hypothetical protein